MKSANPNAKKQEQPEKKVVPVITQKELDNLEIVFEYAKKQVMKDDDELFNLLIIKKDIISKLKKLADGSNSQ